MRVGLTASVVYSVPPLGYGGETAVWDLAIGLNRIGVETYIFATAGSQKPENGKLFTIPHGGWQDLHKEHGIVGVYEDRLRECDIIHDYTHVKYVQDWAYYNYDKMAVGTTWGTFYVRPLSQYNLCTWSKSHMSHGLSQGAYTRPVYGGVNADFYTPNPDYSDKGYFLWLARWHPTKRPEVFMALAKQNPDKDFVMSGSNKESPDHTYWFIEYTKKGVPSNIRFIEIPLNTMHHEIKRQIFRDAKALIVPWMGECFGLIAVEAMACGCPVIAVNEGAMPEIITHGSDGYLCTDLPRLNSAIKSIEMIDRRKARQKVLQLFTREEMARRYLQIYKDVLDGRGWSVTSRPIPVRDN